MVTAWDRATCRRRLDCTERPLSGGGKQRGVKTPAGPSGGGGGTGLRNIRHKAAMEGENRRKGGMGRMGLSRSGGRGPHNEVP